MPAQTRELPLHLHPRRLLALAECAMIAGITYAITCRILRPSPYTDQGTARSDVGRPELTAMSHSYTALPLFSSARELREQRMARMLAESPARFLRWADENGIGVSEADLDAALGSLGMADPATASFLNSLSRPLRNRAWGSLVSARIATGDISGAFELSLLAEAWGSSPTPMQVVLDEALSRDPDGAISMVEAVENPQRRAELLRNLFDSYAAIDVTAALDHAALAFAGTPRLEEMRVAFALDMLQKYPEQVASDDVLRVLPERGNRIGNIRTLAQIVAMGGTSEARLVLLSRLESPLERQAALGAIACSPIGDEVFDYVPQLSSHKTRSSAFLLWGSRKVADSGVGAISEAMALDSATDRYSAVRGAIRQLSHNDAAAMVTEVARLVGEAGVPNQLWEMVFDSTDLDPEQFDAQEQSDLPPWISELDPAVREALVAAASRRHLTGDLEP